MATTAEEVAALKATVEHFVTDFHEATRQAAGARKLMYEAQEETNLRLQAFDNRLSIIEPPAKHYAVWKERFIGMQMAVGFLWAAIAAGFVYLYTQITGR